MSVFSKRKTPIQNIAYIAIMGAINVLFVLLSNVFPLLLFLLVFILPLTSTIVTIFCNKKYYPIYFIVTLALCILVSYGFSIFDTLVYVIPSLITGFLFGFCFEKSTPMILILLGNTILEFLLSLLTFYILGSFITNMNMMNTLISAFGLTNFAFKKEFALIFLYVIAQIQIVLSYAFIKVELKRFGLEFNLNSPNRYLMYVVSICLFLVAIISYFYFSEFTIVFTLMPLVIYVYETSTLIMKKKTINYVLLGIGHLAFIFIFAFLYSCLAAPNQFILLYVLFGLVTIIDFLDNYCFHRNTNNIK